MARIKKDEFLKFLRFDPQLNNSKVAGYLKNPRLVILLLILIIGVGINAFINLPRDLNPQVKIPIVLVSTILPGAGPQDVESLITVPIEDSVNSLDKVKNVTSQSLENASTVTIEFESGVDPDKAKSDVQSAVDSVTDLPEDATSPRVIKLDFENAPIWTFVLTGKTDDGSLFKFGTNLKEKLENLPEIDSVGVAGLEETEIKITINPEVYTSYGINPFQLSQAVSSGFKSFPAGSIRTENSNFSLTIDPGITTIDDIRKVRINLSGQNVTLAEIATVSEAPKPSQNQSFIARDDDKTQRAITFNVLRVKTYNIDQAVNAAHKTVDEEIETHGAKRFEAITLINTAEEIDHQFSELTRDFLITVVLVVLVLFIFLGPRQALVSSLSAPLSFLITFIVMQQTGITLNFLSLFSLILSLGLLVDDTVVVISAISFYYKTKRFTPVQAGLLVWRDFLVPVATTTITTVWAFLPLLLASGIIGEFIKSIPIVVSTALIASFFVGMFITLPLMVILLKPEIPGRVISLLRIVVLILIAAIIYSFIPKGNLFIFEIFAVLLFIAVVFVLRDILLINIKSYSKKMIRHNNPLSKLVLTLSKRNYQEGVISFERINHAYKSLIEKILLEKRHRRMVVTMVVIFSIFSFLLLPLGFVKNEFFPKTDANIVYATIEFAPGTHIDVTKEEGLRFLSEINKTEGVNFVSLDLGTSLNMESGGTRGDSNSLLFSLNLKDEGKRPESFEIAEILREKFKDYQKGKFQVIEQSGGPPVGADVQIKLLGDDLAVLDKKADEVVIYLEKNQGITNAEKSIKSGTSKIVFSPSQELLTENNISVDQIGGLLRLYASGVQFENNKFPGDTEDKDITLRLYDNSSYVNSLDQLNIPTPIGNIPLSSLGQLSLENNPTQITREGGKRTISVSAAVKRGYNSQSINTDLVKFADSDLSLPDSYEWKTGGANEENEASVNSILQAMILSFMLIIVTMVIQFSSFRRALIVMLVIPLSISGVFVIFALTKTPLSFPALIGVLALFGIVVKNSILVVDKIVENEKHDMSLIESISEASASRLEPIALTSFATILGLIPITVTDPLWRGLGGAIIAGLTFSGIIMLFFIPVVYFAWFNKSPQRRIKNNKIKA